METQDRGSSNVWTPERMELVRRTVCPPALTDDEFALFVEQCKRSGLDPLLKEAFCVPRRQNAGSREKPHWVTRHEFQPSETGMLARAERFPDFLGVQASAVFAGDEIIMDQGKGEVVHRFSPVKRSGPIVGAWARVARSGDKLPVLVWLDFEGYAQTTPLWSKIPTTMLEKCARVAALRKAYPEAFGGLYIREEMPAEEPTGEDSPPKGGRRRPREEAPASPPPAAEAVPAVPAPAPAAATSNVVPMRPAAAETLATNEEASWTDERLDAAVREGDAWVRNNPKHKHIAAGMARLQHLRDELWRREIARNKLPAEPGAGG